MGNNLAWLAQNFTVSFLTKGVHKTQDDEVSHVLQDENKKYRNLDGA
eukprot:CAMPEP_0172655534 /NCGR_PEP_ID=MMETSP1074-20121228/731_1 /TAXON_ID=2916 /ORGANISM="Ceratium fusus, Strain PA161109" /LENGTH=46 /DNA_ID= /DNA_START= /DNA_END= /DNA_ORIENTATION=